MRNAVFMGNNPQIFESVYAGLDERIRQKAKLHPRIITRTDFTAEKELLRQTNLIFSTWGMPVIGKDELDEFLPNLETVFYAAGSVQNFAAPLLDSGVRVFSGWGANAVPVAQFSLAQILLALKGYFRNYSDAKRDKYLHIRHESFRGHGIYDGIVGILGAGMIGRTLINFLQPHRVRILVFDPFLPDEDARRLGVTKTSLEDLFSRSHVISNHLANNEKTRGMLTEALFGSMQQDSVFINTGRGATVDEPGMIRVLQNRTDLMALLDVTFPEPPAEDSPLYTMDNVFLSRHIAGAMNSERFLLGEFMVREFEAWLVKGPLQYEVSRAMLETMA